MRPVPMIRSIVARNVVRLRDAKYAALPHATARNKHLAKDAGTTLSQIQRIVASQVGTSIDLIESLADTFGVSPADLLTPYLTPTDADPHGERRRPNRQKPN